MAASVTHTPSDLHDCGISQNDVTIDPSNEQESLPEAVTMDTSQDQESLQKDVTLDTSRDSDRVTRRSRFRRRSSEKDDSACDSSDQIAELLAIPGRALDKAEVLLDKAEDLARRVWEAGWEVVHHRHLPKWLRDNDFLVEGHRPPLNSFKACIKSIFRVHTETGNIWTHMLGFIAFIIAATIFLCNRLPEGRFEDKLVFSAFFAGAILCLGFSFAFHTFICHSPQVCKLFSKLDYCGISLLTMGSFIPWLYYTFYCSSGTIVLYLVCMLILGSCCITFSMMDKFAEPKFRPMRAGTFIALGLSGGIPALHLVLAEGWYKAIHFASLGWLGLMALLYISGALIYAVRIPERIWPGKFDIWFQSHQIFHVFVVAAAFVHFHGISQVAQNRISLGACLEVDA